MTTHSNSSGRATTAVNGDSATIVDAIAPFVASFGFKIHDQAPPRFATCSCFFLVINDHWVLCTAAHVMHEIEILQGRGIKLTDWHVNDVFTKTEQEFAYPFDLTTRDRLFVRDDVLGLDYCLIYVDYIAATSMQSRGLQALSRTSVGQAEDAEKWVLTGFPSAFTSLTGQHFRQCHHTIGVTPIERPADWNPEQSQYSLFGRLDDSGEQFSNVDIGGMSGGPIFGLFKLPSGKLSVKLVAVQSGWSKRSRVITACPIRPFLDAVDRLIADDL